MFNFSLVRFKKYISICLYVNILLFVCFSSIGQSISPVTQNIGGTLGLQNNYSLTFSVGEMVSTTNFIGTNKVSISSGFLQSFTPIVTGFDNINAIAPGVISISPNPIVSKMFVKAIFSKPGDLTFNIIDVGSKVKYASPTFKVFNEITKEVDLSTLVAGVYYVRVLFQPLKGNPEIGIYKLIKL